MQCYGNSDKGQKREHNEDYFITDADSGISIVCDGMGGHASGEVASQQAAKTVWAFLRQHQARLIELSAQDTPESRTEISKLLTQSVLSACKAVYDHAQTQAHCKGMGTTLTLLMVINQKGLMAHVGDSRLYLLRDQVVHQISEDHTYINALLHNGYTLAEALQSPYAHTITRAVGIEPQEEVDTLVFDILPGDTFLLCSDGLHNYLQDTEQLRRMMAVEPVQAIPQQLIAFANQQGGKDNITAIAVRFDQAVADKQKNKQIRLKLDSLKQMDLFKDLSLNELSKVISACIVKKFAAGSRVIQENTPGDVLYVLLEGSVALSRQDKPLRTLQAGSHFGEMAFINNRPRSATVKTQEDCLFLIFSQHQFQALVKTQPVIANKILMALARELSNRLDDQMVATLHL